MNGARHWLVSTVLGLAVSAGMLWWLLSGEAVDALVRSLHGAQPWRLGLALLLVPTIEYLRAWRFELLRTGRMGPPGWRMFLLAARLVMFTLAFPFRLGDLSFPVMMKRAFGTPLMQGAGILVLARVLDASVLAGALLLAAAALLDPAVVGWSRPALLAAAVAALAAPFLGVMVLTRWRPLFGPPSLAALIDRLLWGVTMLRAAPQSALAFALSVAVWAVHFVVAWLAVTAVTDALDPLRVALAAAASYLAFAVPVPYVAGLGPPQAAWAAALNLAGIGWETAIVTALTAHGVLLIGPVGLGLATFLLRGPALPRSRQAAGG